MAAEPGGSFYLNSCTQPDSGEPGGSFLLDTCAGVKDITYAGGIIAPWKIGAPQDSTLRVPWPKGNPLDYGMRALYGVARPADVAFVYPWVLSVPTDRGTRMRWSWYPRYARLQTTQRIPWGTLIFADRGRRFPWGYPAPCIDPIAGENYLRALQGLFPRVGGSLTEADLWHYQGIFRPGACQKSSATRYPAITHSVPWNTSTATDKGKRIPWGNYTRENQTARGITISWSGTTPSNITQRFPFGNYWRTLDAGWGVPSEATPPIYDENGTLLIPNKEVYVVQNQSYLVITDTGENIPCTGLTIGIDADSWAWTLSASITRNASTAFQPGTPVGVTASVNGELFKFIVESMGTSREFGNSGAGISGRSPIAVQHSPYAAVTSRSNTGDRTARQLMDDALLYTGITVDWDLVMLDWLVPAGVFTNTSTPLGAVLDIGNTVRAVMQADRTLDQINILPRYAVAPWYWHLEIPDVVIPLAATVTEGVEWLSLPEYNRVFVSGVNAGVLGQVTKTGTAGDKVAPMVTEQLVTHADAARQRGLAVLGNTGRIARTTLEMPIADDIPLLAVGQLVLFEDPGEPDWYGLIRGVQVTVTLTNNVPVARQHVTVERQFNEPV